VLSHFAPEYVQIVDGEHLDRATFSEHVRALRSAVVAGEVAFDALVSGPGLIATRHLVTARKRDGSVARLEVHAFFDVQAGLVTRTRELTHLLEGAPADRDLGSRTQPGA